MNFKFLLKNNNESSNRIFGKIDSADDVLTPNIFIVKLNDDNILEEMINSLGYNIVGVETNLDVAFEKISEIRPDLVLLNLTLNDEEKEIQLAINIKNLNIPFICTLDHINKEILDYLISINTDGYLISPFDKLDVKRMIDVTLRNHTKINQLISTSKNKVLEKKYELIIEKISSLLLLFMFIFIIVSSFIAKNATWLQFVVFIPSVMMLALACVSLKKPKKVVPYDKLPYVTIIIPAHNEENSIENTIKSISSLDYFEDGKPHFEIIVCNDGSTDSTGEILNNLKEEYNLTIITRLPPKSGKGKGFVLNDALAISNGEIIGIFDADTRINKDFLKIIIHYLNHEKVVGVQSRVKMYNKDENFLTRMQHVEFSAFQTTLRAKDVLNYAGFLGGNGQFVKKEAIIKSGKWDGFAVTEDLNLSVKLLLNGYGIRYCGEVAVYQEAVSEWGAFFRQRIRWATGNFETVFIYGQKILRSDLPFIRKISMIDMSMHTFNLFIFFGFLIFILNLISWFIFKMPTFIRLDLPLIIGIISTIGFFPVSIISLLRDKPTFKSFIKDLISYYIYCFHLIPLFFLTMYKMITRKERKWSKTEHNIDENYFHLSK